MQAESKGNSFRNIIYICCIIIAICCFLPVAETDPRQLSSGSELADSIIHMFDDDISDAIDYEFTLFTVIDDDIKVDMREFGYMYIVLIVIICLLATAWKSKIASALLILASLGSLVLDFMLMITPDAIGQYGNYDLKLIAAMWAWTPVFYVLGICSFVLIVFSILLKVQSGKYENEKKGWQCPNCGNRNLGGVCLYCGIKKPEVTSNDFSASSWKCENCGYITSVGEYCMKCGKPRNKKTEENPTWICNFCGCTTNTGDFCRNCGKSKYEKKKDEIIQREIINQPIYRSQSVNQSPKAQPPKAQSPKGWFCPKCGQVNGGDTCTSCGAPRQ